MRLPWRVLRLVVRVRQGFRDLDGRLATFQSASGLGCPPGCGRCCESPEVETTALEMVPLAFHLWRTGQAERFLALAQAEPEPASCIFYERDPLVPGNGRCSVYAERPGICRLFAFAGRIGKNGRSELTACRVMREAMPERVFAATVAIASGDLPVPLFGTEASQLTDIDTRLGAQRLPINRALAEALQLLVFQARMLAEERGETGSRNDGHVPPEGPPALPPVTPPMAG